MVNPVGTAVALGTYMEVTQIIYRMRYFNDIGSVIIAGRGMVESDAYRIEGKMRGRFNIGGKTFAYDSYSSSWNVFRSN